MKAFFILFIFTFVFSSQEAKAEGDTFIVNIFANRPEQRKQSRWTLSDWMKTKERISMMDMWLAHHGGKTMLPELALSGFYTFSKQKLIDANGNTSTIDNVNYYFANMDFYFLPLKLADFGIYLNAKAIANAWSGINDSVYNAGTLFRIFGTNIQNSSIVIKFGYNYSEIKIDQFGMSKNFFAGFNVGADMQLYIIDFLGLRTGINYLPKNNSKNDNRISLSNISYNVKLFLEYKVLKFEGGYYKECNTVYLDNGENKFQTSGWIVGGQINF